MRMARILFPDAVEAAACLAVAMRRRVSAAKALHATRVPPQISKNFVIIMSGGLRPPFCLGRQVPTHHGESSTELALKQRSLFAPAFYFDAFSILMASRNSAARS